MAQIVRGSDLMLFDGTTNKAFAFATNHTLELSGDVLETSSKDSGKWKSNQITKLSWTITSENLYSEEDYDDLVEKMIARDEFDVIFAIAGNADSDAGVPEGGWTPKANSGYKGKAVITSISVSAQDGQNATYSVNLQGTGALEKITASV
ncbi:phage tail protein [Phocaeicola barnesiae]|uniref:Phage tail protein n=1 Tax=Phocaeicola barnesiae TaxID=376804 RepID=A0AAW5NAR0_9BACT|nr:phage tail protein [Phocaeicola barnesiae]MCR8874890.1 phage tail protein [Phocaeicola barnesiae]